MKKTSAEILVNAAMLVLIASCGCDFVIGDVSRTGILGCVAGGLWFWYSLKQDDKSRQPKEKLLNFSFENIEGTIERRRHDKE